jgi:hypothetical protein
MGISDVHSLLLSLITPASSYYFKSRLSACGYKQRLNNTLNIPKRAKPAILRTSEVFKIFSKKQTDTPLTVLKRFKLAKNAKISVKNPKKGRIIGHPAFQSAFLPFTLSAKQQSTKA